MRCLSTDAPPAPSDRLFPVQAVKHARAVFERPADSRAEAMSAATDLLGAIALFMQALPHVQDARSNALIRKNVALLLDDSARLRELASAGPGGADGRSTPGNTGCDAPAGAAMRRRIADELVATERTYCKSLDAFVHAFVVPLRPRDGDSGTEGSVLELTNFVLGALGAAPPPASSELLSTSEHELLFGSVEQLLPLNRMMLEQLEAAIGAWDASSCVGSILFRFAPFFKLYAEAFYRQLQAPQLLQRLEGERPGFSEFIAEASASPTCGGHTIDSFLILPVQRVPRYRMFLEQLLKYTPADHPDFTPCTEALSEVCRVHARSPDWFSVSFTAPCDCAGLCCRDETKRNPATLRTKHCYVRCGTPI